MANYRFTAAASGGGNGSNWTTQALTLEDFVNIMKDSHSITAAEGDNFWFKTGDSFSFSATEGNLVATADGTTASPLVVSGMGTDDTTVPTGNNRPLIECGAYDWILDNYIIQNAIRFTTSDTIGIRTDNGGLTVNCKCTSSSSTVNAFCFYGGGDRNRWVSCEASNTNGKGTGYGFRNNLGSTVIYSYCHGLDVGVNHTSAYSSSLFTTIEDCDTALLIGSNIGLLFINLTLDSCNTGISATTSAEGIVSSIIFSNMTTSPAKGADWSSGQYDSNYVDYNNYYNCTTDRTNVKTGPNDIDTDPKYTTSGSDFSLQSDSGSIGTGQGITLGVG